MGLPGFTGDRAAYRSAASYAGTATFGAASAGVTLAQPPGATGVFANPCFWACYEGCMAAGAAPLTPGLSHAADIFCQAMCRAACNLPAVGGGGATAGGGAATGEGAAVAGGVGAGTVAAVTAAIAAVTWFLLKYHHATTTPAPMPLTTPPGTTPLAPAGQCGGLVATGGFKKDWAITGFLESGCERAERLVREKAAADCARFAGQCRALACSGGKTCVPDFRGRSRTWLGDWPGIVCHASIAYDCVCKCA